MLKFASKLFQVKPFKAYYHHLPKYWISSAGESHNLQGYKFFQKGNYQDAYSQFLQALAEEEKAGSQNKKLKLNIFINLGNTANILGYFSEAQEALSKGLKLAISQYGDNSLEAAQIYSALGTVYIEFGKSKEAIEYLEHSLTIYESQEEKDNSAISSIYNNLGRAYYEDSQLDKALMYYNKALKIAKTQIGENSVEVANTYNNISMIHASQGDFDKSIELRGKALRILLKIEGELNPHVFGLYANLGEACISKKQYDLAYEYLTKALEIGLTIFGENNNDVALVYQDLAWVALSRKDYEGAVSLIEKSLEIRRSTPEDPQGSIKAYVTYAQILRKTENWDLAIGFLLKAEKLCQKWYKGETDRLVDIYYLLTKLYLDKKDLKKAKFYCEKALKVSNKYNGLNHAYYEVLSVLANQIEFQLLLVESE